MKPSLQLRLSQHLTLTPQLQLSIRLLQLSTQELDQEIEGFLRDNPLLERDEAMSDMTDSTAPAPLPPRTEYEQEQAAAPASDALAGGFPSGALAEFSVAVPWLQNTRWAVNAQNLLDNRHPEFGTAALLRSLRVEIQRAVYGKVTWRF